MPTTPWAARLVNELVDAADERVLAKPIARNGRLDLLIVEELGCMEPGQARRDDVVVGGRARRSSGGSGVCRS